MTDSQDERDGDRDARERPATDGSRDPASERSRSGSDRDPGPGDEPRSKTDEPTNAGDDAAAADRPSRNDGPNGGEDSPIVDPEIIDVPRRLEGGVRYLWIIGTGIGAVVAGIAIGLLAAFVLEDYLWTGGVVALIVFLLGIVRAILLYRSWRYFVREESLFLRRGVFTRVQTVVPYVRVQHIDTRRSPLERVLGLSSLVVYTAGSRGADVTIPGLTPDRADTLQSRLERLAIESEEDAV